jgi:hypothetical protein
VFINGGSFVSLTVRAILLLLLLLMFQITWDFMLCLWASGS